MQKRILWVVIFGISCAPILLAGGHSEIDTYEARKAGELSFSQIMEGQGAGCNLKGKKELRESGTSTRNSSTTKARSAK